MIRRQWGGRRYAYNWAIRTPAVANPQLSQLVELAGSMANGPQRSSLYEQINQYVMQNGPFVVLYQPLIVDAVSDRLRDVHLNPIWGIELQDLSRA